MHKWLLPRTSTARCTVEQKHIKYSSFIDTHSIIHCQMGRWCWQCLCTGCLAPAPIRIYDMYALDVQCLYGGHPPSLVVCTSFHILFESHLCSSTPSAYQQCLPSSMCYLRHNYNQQLQLFAQCLPRTQFHQVLCSLIENSLRDIRGMQCIDADGRERERYIGWKGGLGRF